MTLTVFLFMSTKARCSLLLSVVVLIPSAALAKHAPLLEDVRAKLAFTLEKRHDPSDTLRFRRLEPALIRASAGRAHRTGNSLTLRFGNGTSRNYTNKSDCEALEGACQTYTLVAFVGPEHFFLLHEQFYEGVGCLMVDSGTGRETELPDIPYLSPSSDRLLVLTGTDGGGGYWPLQIWRRQGDTAFLEWKQSDAPPNHPIAISAVKWERNDQIGLTIVTDSRIQPPPVGFVPTRSSVTLTYTANRWSIEPNVAK